MSLFHMHSKKKHVDVAMSPAQCDRPQSRSSKVPKQVEELIDEKCRSLNKTGVPKGSALHLAQWMKGQLDKQVVESDPIDSDPELAIEEWSLEQVTNRSKELKLVDPDGNLCRTTTTTAAAVKVNGIGASSVAGGSGSTSKLTDGGHTEDSSTFDGEDDNRSVSKSTTSDSQVSTTKGIKIVSQFS